jgi:hypothetical protein
MFNDNDIETFSIMDKFSFIFNVIIIKFNKVIILVGSLLTSIFIPKIPAMILLGIMIFLNLFSGIWKTYGTDKIHLGGLKKTGIKLTTYLVALVSAGILEAIILDAELFIFKTVSIYFAVNEFISILLNVEHKTGKSLLTFLSNRLGSIFKEVKDANIESNR